MGETSGTRTAACNCGALKLHCEGAPASVNLCSCKSCQRRSGGAFAYTAFYPETAVRIEGASKNWRRPAHSGESHEGHFCPTCGAGVFARLGVAPGMLAVAVGAFADPDFPPPTRFFWTGTRHGWLGPLAGAEDIERQ